MKLSGSYAYCREVARTRAKNFYYAFRLLDPQRRDSLSAIYAFMRHCDDLSDEPGASALALEQWRMKLDAALAGRPGPEPLWPGFVDTVERYAIPQVYFHEMIEGVTSDLGRTSVATFSELYRYCYQVASVAGLSLIHIFGFRDQAALPLAEKCGVAFQLTNIIRDVREDADRGRVYLPEEDCRRFGVDAEELLETRAGPALRQLLAYEADRARGYYAESRPLVAMVDPSCRASLAALIEIYSTLLERIAARDYEVLQARVRLSPLEKAWILFKHRVRPGR
jgi:phytoene synthase